MKALVFESGRAFLRNVPIPRPRPGFALRTRRVDVSGMISAELPLSQAARALALAGRRGVRKVLLKPA